MKEFYERILVGIIGLVLLFLSSSLFLWTQTDGMYWAVRHGAMAGGLMIVTGIISGIVFVLGGILVVYGIVGPGKSEKEPEPNNPDT